MALAIPFLPAGGKIPGGDHEEEDPVLARYRRSLQAEHVSLSFKAWTIARFFPDPPDSDDADDYDPNRGFSQEQLLNTGGPTPYLGAPYRIEKRYRHDSDDPAGAPAEGRGAHGGAQQQGGRRGDQWRGREQEGGAASSEREQHALWLVGKLTHEVEQRTTQIEELKNALVEAGDTCARLRDEAGLLIAEADAVLAGGASSRGQTEGEGDLGSEEALSASSLVASAVSAVDFRGHSLDKTKTKPHLHGIRGELVREWESRVREVLGGAAAAESSAQPGRAEEDQEGPMMSSTVLLSDLGDHGRDQEAEATGAAGEQAGLPEMNPPPAEEAPPASDQLLLDSLSLVKASLGLNDRHHQQLLRDNEVLLKQCRHQELILSQALGTNSGFRRGVAEQILRAQERLEILQNGGDDLEVLYVLGAGGAGGFRAVPREQRGGSSSSTAGPPRDEEGLTKAPEPQELTPAEKETRRPMAIRVLKDHLHTLTRNYQDLLLEIEGRGHPDLMHFADLDSSINSNNDPPSAVASDEGGTPRTPPLDGGGADTSTPANKGEQRRSGSATNTPTGGLPTAPARAVPPAVPEQHTPLHATAKPSDDYLLEQIFDAQTERERLLQNHLLEKSMAHRQDFLASHGMRAGAEGGANAAVPRDQQSREEALRRDAAQREGLLEDLDRAPPTSTTARAATRAAEKTAVLEHFHARTTELQLALEQRIRELQVGLIVARRELELSHKENDGITHKNAELGIKAAKLTEDLALTKADLENLTNHLRQAEEVHVANTKWVSDEIGVRELKIRDLQDKHDRKHAVLEATGKEVEDAAATYERRLLEEVGQHLGKKMYDIIHANAGPQERAENYCSSCGPHRGVVHHGVHPVALRC